MLIYVPVEVPDDQLAEFLIQSGAELPIGSVGNSSPTPRRTQSAPERDQGRDPWDESSGPTSGGHTDGGGPARDARPAARTTSGGSPARGDDRVVNVKTKNGVQTWRFPADAPQCDCGEPAGLVSALGSNNKRYKAYRCAKRSGDDWRSACDFNEFTR